MKTEIFPSSFTGHNRRIELAGTDLWITPRIDNVFVYPGDLNINRFKDALGHILALWPLVCGRLLLHDGEHYVIEMSDKAVPVTIVDNTELKQWPLNSNVVWDAVEGQLQPFLDEVQTTKLWHGSPDEPLFRLKITRLIQSGEWVLGISWAHVLGDACACLNFLHAFSCSYQQIEPPTLLPSFERRLWSRDELRHPQQRQRLRHQRRILLLRHRLVAPHRHRLRHQRRVLLLRHRLVVPHRHRLVVPHRHRLVAPHRHRLVAPHRHRLVALHQHRLVALHQHRLVAPHQPLHTLRRRPKRHRRRPKRHRQRPERHRRHPERHRRRPHRKTLTLILMINEKTLTLILMLMFSLIININELSF
ncbi:unnamed protein product [Rotaria sordida]|uniref:Uncharacterized protein n=1 Tax=Rotaria sordida TaxID=392033 RepID=A0A813UHB9_9BILA|nr:unnamed protein product [Rotaria sordida]